MNPPVTVLMSVHNGAAFLRPAVESVLAQTFADFEFLILDDASTDATPSLLAAWPDPRIRVLRIEKNIGLTACLNRGLAEARGEFIARQDADDVWMPQRLGEHLAFLRTHPEVGAVGSQVRLIDERDRSLGRKDYPLTHAAICWGHLFENAFAHAAVTFRASVVRKAGGYDETFTSAQDRELWSRLSEQTELANLPARLTTLRVRPDSITRTHRRADLVRRAQEEHWRRLFPERPGTEEEHALIAAFRSQVAPADVPRFRRLVLDLAAKRPATTDLRRTIALLWERLGYNLLATAPALGLQQIFDAIRTSPPRAFALPWLKIAALTLLGGDARRFYEKFRS
jgi:glycosyltransferase involved in cell wall biosynthesis